MLKKLLFVKELRSRLINNKNLHHRSIRKIWYIFKPISNGSLYFLKLVCSSLNSALEYPHLLMFTLGGLKALKAGKNVTQSITVGSGAYEASKIVSNVETETGGISSIISSTLSNINGFFPKMPVITSSPKVAVPTGHEMLTSIPVENVSLISNIPVDPNIIGTVLPNIPVVENVSPIVSNGTSALNLLSAVASLEILTGGIIFATGVGLVKYAESSPDLIKRLDETPAAVEKAMNAYIESHNPILLNHIPTLFTTGVYAFGSKVTFTEWGILFLGMGCMCYGAYIFVKKGYNYLNQKTSLKDVIINDNN